MKKAKKPEKVRGMKNILLILPMLFISNILISPVCFADEAQEKMYLHQILNQLDAMQPLIIAAKKSQPTNSRIQFHYTQFRDSQGRLHHGLLEDIHIIRSGIAEKLNSITIEPRAISPIKGDYDDRR